ncbi:hypothetical protein CCY99_03395 [Helicobacter sp. 16-1353]|uniref:anthranilate synthase component II n=1 Tax=Helicobacter sp. 16-1353 TaxID=2004996 RepID=UPI000DCE19FD|nr:aminodeoxychorismate/anthranilate synthase component II [Helicobacter sp. 16-1353]RAX54411.1 hypothetical protein CCY99_03395 [Helicobacter sp. 16-1353]
MLIIDNYDSFTYNIVQYFQILGIKPIIIQNDKKSLSQIKQLKFNRIVLGPGWGTPDNAGISLDIIDFYRDRLPILGVCLGMQCIAKYYGASIIKATKPYHGKTSQVYFNQHYPLFNNIKQGFNAIRYHSLIIDIPKNNFSIKVIANTDENIPMAIKIKDKNIYGVQFHPEGILTESGIEIFRNFLNTT